MSRRIVDLPSLTIALDGTTSGAVGSLEDAVWIAIYAPAALTGTVTVQAEPSAAGTAWVDLTVVDGTSDVTVPAGNVVVIRQIGFRRLRLVSGSSEAAARTFAVIKQIEI